jgi:hypothetical protein
MTTDDDALERLARELYPDNGYLQQQWLRGVRLVRTTARGWLLDPLPLPTDLAELHRKGAQAWKDVASAATQWVERGRGNLEETS